MNLAILKEQIPDLSYDELINHLRLSKVNSDEYIGLVILMKNELEDREPTINYSCKNCKHTKFDEQQLRSARGGFTAIFDIQTGLYQSIICQRCK
ncbi:MAG: hypothetical protein JKY19_08525 [Alcanivoracaceae bacterium]|nr:hypothetical protein [Alcanivoracaceae bacterium]